MKSPSARSCPDPKFTDAPADQRRRITKFINMVMSDGKKATAERIVYGAFDLVAERAKDDPTQGLGARDLPTSGPGSRSRAAASVARPTRSRSTSAPTARWRWACAGWSATPAAATRRPWSSRLANEIIDAAQNRGYAVKKREDVHKMADANKAFAHYRW